MDLLVALGAQIDRLVGQVRDDCELAVAECEQRRLGVLDEGEVVRVESNGAANGQQHAQPRQEGVGVVLLGRHVPGGVPEGTLGDRR